MVNTGFTIAGTGANNADAGDRAWANPTRVNADDGSNSTTASQKSGNTSQYLHASSFGFAIPAGATIDGIVARVQRLASANSVITDHTIQLLNAGTRTGDNKADVVTTWTTAAVNADYGAASDLWGNALTPAIVNASTFGLAVRTSASGGGGTTASCDVIWLDVYYHTVAYPIPRRATRFFTRSY